MANGPRPFPNNDLSWKNMKDRWYISVTSPVKWLFWGAATALMICLGIPWITLTIVVVLNMFVFPFIDPIGDYVVENMSTRLILFGPIILFLFGAPDGTGSAASAAFGLVLVLLFAEFLVLGCQYLWRYFSSRGNEGSGETDTRD